MTVKNTTQGNTEGVDNMTGHEAAGGAGGDAGANGNGNGGGDGEGGDGGDSTATNWLDGLPDELKGHDALKEIKTPEDMAKRLAELHGKVPTIPEKAEDYTFQAPDGVQMDQPLMDGFKDFAHKGGLTQDQFHGAIEFYNEFFLGRIDQAINDTDTALSKEWGADKEKNMEAAQGSSTPWTASWKAS